MKEFSQLLTDHPILAFLSLCSSYYLLKFVLYYIPARIVRMMNIRTHGWPPPHVDADGDLKPDPEKEES